MLVPWRVAHSTKNRSKVNLNLWDSKNIPVDILLMPEIPNNHRLDV